MIMILVWYQFIRQRDVVIDWFNPISSHYLMSVNNHETRVVVWMMIGYGAA